MTSDEIRAIEHECARLIAAYANLNDAGEWAAVADLYTRDGRFARPSAPDDWIEGADAILAAFVSRPARKTRHVCSNIVVSVIDADNAEAESAMVLFIEDGGIKVGSFHDRFRLTAAGWRFAERRGTITF